MAKKISELDPLLGSEFEATDKFVMVDDSENETKRASVSEVVIGLGLVIGTDVQAHSSILDAVTASFLIADKTKLDGIEALAEVTSTAKVTAAGALMDSELTDIAAVKALDQGVATTDSPEFAGVFLGGSAAANKLDNVEAGDYTATLTPETSGTITVSGILNQFAYRRVNDLVTITGFLFVDSISSPVGDMVDVPLPFTVADLQDQAARMGVGIVYKDNSSGVFSVLPFVVLEGDAIGSIVINASTIGGNDEFSFSFSYIAA